MNEERLSPQLADPGVVLPVASLAAPSAQAYLEQQVRYHRVFSRSNQAHNE
jgi:hypothetical protein